MRKSRTIACNMKLSDQNKLDLIKQLAVHRRSGVKNFTRLLELSLLRTQIPTRDGTNPMPTNHFLFAINVTTMKFIHE